MNNTDNNQIVEDKHSKIEEIKEAMKKTDSKRMYQIEGLWGWLKEEVICNVFFPVVEAIRKAVQGFISSINKVPMHVIDRLCLRM